MPETVLWLLRHPEPEASAQGRCYGALEVGLSDRGIRQAHAIANLLATEPLEAIYTSPRQRCQQAASTIAAGRTCPVEIIDGLHEMNFGDFEGLSYDEIEARYPEIYRQWMQRPTETRFPGGEDFGDMCTRVLAAANWLRSRNSGRSIALVTHGGVNRIILADALGMERSNIFHIAQRYAAVNLIRYFENSPVVELVNGLVTEK
jgi:alpha-ribazole phosphatase